ncbi:MAG: TetR/AcrR family transcriptional regulator [Caldilineaceae bacterium]
MPKPTFFNLPEDKKSLILGVAIEEFIAQGFDGASISQMVQRAGIAKGSFYQYFEDKQDLFDHLLEMAGAQKGAYLSTPPPADVSPFDYLRWLLHGNLGFEASHPRLARLVSDVVAGGGEGSRAIRARLEAATTDFYRGLLAQGVEQGHLDPDLDLDVATFIFTTTSMQLSQYIIQHASNDLNPEDLLHGAQNSGAATEIEAFFSSYLTILEKGMGKKGSPQ